MLEPKNIPNPSFMVDPPRPIRWLISKRLIALSLFFLVGCSDPLPPPEDKMTREPGFVGSATCQTCHQEQFSNWQDSDHQLAMQIATGETVLGDFSDAQFEYFGKRTDFLTINGAFIVRTEDRNGEQRDFEVTHTFGVDPLQQYLVSFPDGRKQALPFAWDSRPEAAGGGRWFHLYPDEYIAPGDPLHWTGINANWNYMCVECHSTNLRMGYDSSSDTFDTTWSEISVGCEACHGPGSKHVTQAKARKFDEEFGLLLKLTSQQDANWVMNRETGLAELTKARDVPRQQPESCGRCHSRRTNVAPEYTYGQPLTDTHFPALLDDILYFADGQIRDEVFVYGSFLQSKMYRSGVTCSDCHDPHSAGLATGPNTSDTCAQCHLTSKLTGAVHAKHPAGKAVCVDCHMTSRTYMGVDDRRDHSFLIPRPDLAETTGAPHACSNCHSDKSDAWAATRLASWQGGAEVSEPHFGEAFAAARAGRANTQLAAIVDDKNNAGIVQATALTLLQWPLEQAQYGSVVAALESPDPLARIGSLRILQDLSADLRPLTGVHLLSDPVRSVRLEAARTYADLANRLTADDKLAFQRAEEELRETYAHSANRPDSHVALAELEIALQNEPAAIREYEMALRLDAGFAPAYLNLADLMRRSGNDERAERLLREGLSHSPDSAALHYSLGLLLTRTKRTVAALSALKKASEIDVESARYAYALGVALNSAGQREAAIEQLTDARGLFPNDYQIGWALATMLRDKGDIQSALGIAQQLRQSYPDDSNIVSLITSLEISPE